MSIGLLIYLGKGDCSMSFPVRQIYISEDQLRQLNRDIWSNKFVEAYILNKGMRERVQLRYRGGHTRDYSKKSYEIVKKNKTYHYNAEYDDPSMIRNALSFRFFERIGVPSPKTKHCLIKLNGKNMGVYLEIEGVDRYFFKQRAIPMQSLVYATNDDANFSLISPETNRRKTSLFDGYQLMIGNDAERKRLERFVSRVNALSHRQLLPYLRSRLDIDNYLHWLAGAVFTGNYDGFHHNYALYRHKGRGYYRIIPWDYEGTWGRDSYGEIFGSNPVPVTGRNHLTKRLLSYKSVRQKYKTIVGHIAKHAFTEKKLAPVIAQMYAKIAPYILEDRTRRWPASVFLNEPGVILEYIRERRKIILRDIDAL